MPYQFVLFACLFAQSAALHIAQSAATIPWAAAGCGPKRRPAEVNIIYSCWTDVGYFELRSFRMGNSGHWAKHFRLDCQCFNLDTWWKVLFIFPNPKSPPHIFVPKIQTRVCWQIYRYANSQFSTDGPQGLVSITEFIVIPTKKYAINIKSKQKRQDVCIWSLCCIISSMAQSLTFTQILLKLKRFYCPSFYTGIL